MNPTLKRLLPVLAAAGVLFGYWHFALAPKRHEAAALAQQVQAKHDEVSAAQAQLAQYRQAKADYPAAFTTLTRLGKAVPADDDVRSLLVQVDAAAQRSGADFHTIELGGGTSSSAGAATAAGKDAPPPGAVAVGSAGFSALPFKLSFQGGFFELSSLFDRLERFVKVDGGQIKVNGRLMLVSSLKLVPKDNSLTQLKADVVATSYMVPSDKDATAGATPSAPTGGATPSAAGGGSQSTPAGSAAATTSTITGVR